MSPFPERTRQKAAALFGLSLRNPTAKEFWGVTCGHIYEAGRLLKLHTEGKKDAASGDAARTLIAVERCLRALHVPDARSVGIPKSPEFRCRPTVSEAPTDLRSLSVVAGNILAKDPGEGDPVFFQQLQEKRKGRPSYRSQQIKWLIDAIAGILLHGKLKADKEIRDGESLGADYIRRGELAAVDQIRGGDRPAADHLRGITRKAGVKIRASSRTAADGIRIETLKTAAHFAVTFLPLRLPLEGMPLPQGLTRQGIEDKTEAALTRLRRTPFDPIDADSVFRAAALSSGITVTQLDSLLKAGETKKRRYRKKEEEEQRRRQNK